MTWPHVTAAGKRETLQHRIWTVLSRTPDELQTTEAIWLGLGSKLSMHGKLLCQSDISASLSAMARSGCARRVGHGGRGRTVRWLPGLEPGTKPRPRREPTWVRVRLATLRRALAGEQAAREELWALVHPVVQPEAKKP